uniref:Uncharacterized protein n=1 Tax=Anopheles culicifacies TaxID=139723 RepID=A0A182MI53_9DIPT
MNGSVVCPLKPQNSSINEALDTGFKFLDSVISFLRQKGVGLGRPSKRNRAKVIYQRVETCAKTLSLSVAQQTEISMPVYEKKQQSLRFGSKSRNDILDSTVELHTMASGTFTQRLLVALTICTLVADLTTLTAARPQESDAASVAAAIRYLQELETKHAQHARPRRPIMRLKQTAIARTFVGKNDTVAPLSIEIEVPANTKNEQNNAIVMYGSLTNCSAIPENPEKNKLNATRHLRPNMRISTDMVRYITVYNPPKVIA